MNRTNPQLKQRECVLLDPFKTGSEVNEISFKLDDTQKKIKEIKAAKKNNNIFLFLVLPTALYFAFDFFVVNSLFIHWLTSLLPEAEHFPFPFQIELSKDSSTLKDDLIKDIAAHDFLFTIGMAIKTGLLLLISRNLCCSNKIRFKKLLLFILAPCILFTLFPFISFFVHSFAWVCSVGLFLCVFFQVTENFEDFLKYMKTNLTDIERECHELEESLEIKKDEWLKNIELLSFDRDGMLYLTVLLNDDDKYQKHKDDFGNTHVSRKQMMRLFNKVLDSDKPAETDLEKIEKHFNSVNITNY